MKPWDDVELQLQVSRRHMKANVMVAARDAKEWLRGLEHGYEDEVLDGEDGGGGGRRESDSGSDSDSDGEPERKKRRMGIEIEEKSESEDSYEEEDEERRTGRQRKSKSRGLFEFHVPSESVVGVGHVRTKLSL